MCSPDDTLSSIEARASELADDLRRAVTDGHAQGLDPAVVRRLFAATVRTFVCTVEAGSGWTAFEEVDGVTATEAAVAAERLLDAAELNPFELTMWSRLGRL